MARDQRVSAIVASADVASHSRVMRQRKGGIRIIRKAHGRELIDPTIAEYGARTTVSSAAGWMNRPKAANLAKRCFRSPRSAPPTPQTHLADPTRRLGTGSR